MFERFTERARQVVVLAQEEARIRPRVAELQQRYSRRIAKAEIRLFGPTLERPADVAAAVAVGIVMVAQAGDLAVAGFELLEKMRHVRNVACPLGNGVAGADEQIRLQGVHPVKGPLHDEAVPLVNMEVGNLHDGQPPCGPGQLMDGNGMVAHLEQVIVRYRMHQFFKQALEPDVHVHTQPLSPTIFQG